VSPPLPHTHTHTHTHSNKLCANYHKKYRFYLLVYVIIRIVLQRHIVATSSFELSHNELKPTISRNLFGIFIFQLQICPNVYCYRTPQPFPYSCCIICHCKWSPRWLHVFSCTSLFIEDKQRAITTLNPLQFNWFKTLQTWLKWF